MLLSVYPPIQKQDYPAQQEHMSERSSSPLMHIFEDQSFFLNGSVFVIVLKPVSLILRTGTLNLIHNSQAIEISYRIYSSELIYNSAYINIPSLMSSIMVKLL